MYKLNQILNSRNCTINGFPAFKALESNPNGEPAVIATDSPALMLERGINEYFAPVLPRNTVYKTTDEIIAADLDANMVTVSETPELTASDDVIIVSRHKGTIEILAGMYPNNIVLDGNVTPEQIENKDVVGTLPPALIQYCGRYKAATIKDFNYQVDGDLAGDELKERLVITGTISVYIN